MPGFLSIENISVSLPGKSGSTSILKDITIDLPKGKTVAIVGPSGSGKTTLLMACAGLLPINAGRIVFNGSPLPLADEAKMTAWRQENVGIVFQHFHLLPSQTALENVAIPLELQGSPNVEARAKELLEQVGLSHRIDHLPSALSGGEQQRVALARAIACKPALLLADEPTGNLDQANGHKVIALLEQQVRDHATTLLLITHDAELAARCDIQIHLLDGQLHGHEVRHDAA